jgi:hypothetical protein
VTHERNLLSDYLHDLGLPADQRARLLLLVAAVVENEVLTERQACAQIVVSGGDGKERLETAIAHGPNVAIAQAILERGTTWLT